MTNLRDDIKQEIKNGNLKETFTLDEVKHIKRIGDICFINNNEYSVTGVGERLANHSVGPGKRMGESVKRGQKSLYNKHEGRGLYSLYIENEGATEKKQTPLSTKPRKSNLSGLTKDQIAKDFVCYLREKPYRIFNNKTNKWQPAAGPVVGWNSRLMEYFWADKSWDETTIILKDFSRKLLDIKTDLVNPSTNTYETCENLYLDIIKWGNPKGTKQSGVFVANRLKELWSENITEVNSTLTKLYAFAEPNEYIIYDSRVANAITTIAEDIYRFKTVNGALVDSVTFFKKCYPFLGTYEATSGTRPRGYRSKWPVAYQKTAAQLDANDLCKRIVRVLNENSEDSRSNWNLRDVEAVLFMDGY